MFPTIKGNILLKNGKNFILNFFRKVDLSIIELYNMELFSNQLFIAKFIRNKDPYTFLIVEWFPRYV